jgi:DNA-binding Lrp family transcriptional regulator
VIAERLGLSESFCLKLSHEYLDYRRPSVWIKVTDEQIIQAFKDHPGDKLITIAKKLNIHSSSLLARARKLKIRP